MKKKEESEKKLYIRPQICRNCGTNGHLYKDCLRPIMSFGIICYKIFNNNIKYLMIQRKDSLSFMEFIRGKYATNDIVYISKLVSSMTQNEINLIKDNSFEELWNYTWVQNNSNNVHHFKHTSEYTESKKKLEYIKTYNILNPIISNINISTLSEQEWGFPKGRRKIKESDIDCAVREFYEETRLSINNIDFEKDILPFEEIFFGTNKILYKHTYFIAKISEKDIDFDITLDNNCSEQIKEVRALKWFSYEEVMNHINIYNIERQQIMKELHSILSLN